MEINYSDGLDFEKTVAHTFDSVEDRSSISKIKKSYVSWPEEYHLSPKRANLIRHLNFRNLEVLEVGGGMGAISRFLAEQASKVTIVEGTKSRCEAIEARLQDLHNWSLIQGNFTDVEIEARFDVVVAVGVLEYSELYIPSASGKTSFDVFVEKMKSYLKPDGVVIIAIENSIGLKYWSGATEDHTGQYFEGVCGYRERLSPKTFSKKELTVLLKRNGLADVDFFYPFPDYKLPDVLLTSKLIEDFPDVAVEVATKSQFRDYSSNHSKFFSDVLAASTLTNAGILSEFANSFLVVASVKGGKTLEHLNYRVSNLKEFGWYYNLSRKFNTVSVFAEDDSGPYSQKMTMKQFFERKKATPISYDLSLSDKFSVKQHFGIRENLLNRKTVYYWLYKFAYFKDDVNFYKLFNDFIGWALASLSTQTSEQLVFNAMDSGITNALYDKESSQPFTLIDLEWVSSKSVPTGWYLFRNIGFFLKDISVFGPILSVKYKNLEEFYNSVCANFGVKPCLEESLKLEVNFQNTVVGNTIEEDFSTALRLVFQAEFPLKMEIDKIDENFKKLKGMENFFGLELENPQSRKLLEALAVYYSQINDSTFASLEIENKKCKDELVEVRNQALVLAEKSKDELVEAQNQALILAEKTKNELIAKHKDELLEVQKQLLIHADQQRNELAEKYKDELADMQKQVLVCSEKYKDELVIMQKQVLVNTEKYRDELAQMQSQVLSIAEKYKEDLAGVQKQVLNLSEKNDKLAAELSYVSSEKNRIEQLLVKSNVDIEMLTIMLKRKPVAAINYVYKKLKSSPGN